MKSVRPSSAAIPKKAVRLPKSAGMPKSKVMSIYRAHVKQMQSTKPVLISQTSTIIGTDNSWFNAQIIPRDPSWVAVNNASYVWYSGNLSSSNAIISKTFSLSLRRNILAATLFLSVDNFAVVIINGVPLLFDGPTTATSNFNPGRTFNIRRFLRKGRNDIVIIAFNANGARSQDNPAGVAARLNINLSALQS
ncbi:hypothetical protein GC093_02080 [Paenibacillus sp. LMG 31456]|uniref:Uncharacterized protein n=1 Tax=Paenibacillus foliorum TaxID=2654974 RepID=A0A972GSN2_9BACL|nr:hypothetical protein [Paenibacillus foliorum]NOU92025.1 hypothetical protein [Paenibacillus foliorum]